MFRKIFKYFSFLAMFLSLTLLIYLLFLGNTNLYMKEYTLSNGNKTIVFQEMAHVAEKEFYVEIGKRLSQYRQEGFEFAYEQVSIETTEESEKIQGLLGINTESYKKLGDLLMLDNQSNHMKLVIDGDLNADINGMELIQLLEDFKREEGTELNKLVLIDFLWTENPTFIRQWFIKSLFRSALIIAKNNDKQFKESGDYIQKVILDKRDQVMFEKIKKYNKDKLVIHYGQFHFEGFWNNLIKEDENWKIVKTDEIKVF